MHRSISFPRSKPEEVGQVDLCEIDNLGSSLLDCCILAGSVLGSHREGPHFSNQGLRLGPVLEMAKAAFIRQYSKSLLVMTWGNLFTKVNLVRPPLVQSALVQNFFEWQTLGVVAKRHWRWYWPPPASGQQVLWEITTITNPEHVGKTTSTHQTSPAPFKPFPLIHRSKDRRRNTQCQSKRSTEQDRRGHQVLHTPMEWVEKILSRNPRWLHPRPEEEEPKLAISLAYTLCARSAKGQQWICPKYASLQLLWTDASLEVTDILPLAFLPTVTSKERWMPKWKGSGLGPRKDRLKCWQKKMRSYCGTG